MKFASLASLAALVVPFMASACGSAEEGSLVVGGDGGTQSSPAGQCGVGDSRECACPASDAGVGTQSCYQGYWLTCLCPYTPVPFNPAAGGDCLPGRYEGTFSGLYSSGFSWGGLPVPVIAFDPFGGPGLALTLTATETGAGEFTEYRVSDGFIKGNADGIFPIEGVLTGSLNCSTKQFSGTLKGWYSLAIDTGTDLNRGFFEGPVHADYDATTHTFINGTWDVLESSQGGALAPLTTAFQTGDFSPGQIVDNLGGNGDWSATFAHPGGADAGVDAGVLSDAGSRADAGP